MNDREIFEAILKRLNILIALQMSMHPAGFSMTDGVKLFTRLGLNPIEVAAILDTTPNAVSVIKSRIKGRK